jgi:hypothetical protein
VPSKDHSIFPRKSMFIGVFMDLKGFVLKWRIWEWTQDTCSNGHMFENEVRTNSSPIFVHSKTRLQLFNKNHRLFSPNIITISGSHRLR